MVYFLAVVRKTGRHQLCTLIVIVSACLMLTAMIMVAATPKALIASVYGCAAALVAHRVFTIRLLIGVLHEVGDGLGLYSPERLSEIESIDA